MLVMKMWCVCFKENWFTMSEFLLTFITNRVCFKPIFIVDRYAMLVKFSKFSYARINRI